MICMNFWCEKMSEDLKEFIARLKGYYSILKIRIPPMSVVTYIEQIEKEMEEKNESVADNR